MESRSLKPDLDGTHCSVTDCFAVADVIGNASVHVDPRVNAAPQEEDLVFDLPFCMRHANLLRMGITSFEFDSGLH